MLQYEQVTNLKTSPTNLKQLVSYDLEESGHCTVLKLYIRLEVIKQPARYVFKTKVLS